MLGCNASRSQQGMWVHCRSWFGVSALCSLTQDMDIFAWCAKVVSLDSLDYWRTRDYVVLHCTTGSGLKACFTCWLFSFLCQIKHSPLSRRILATVASSSSPFSTPKNVKAHFLKGGKHPISKSLVHLTKARHTRIQLLLNCPRIWIGTAQNMQNRAGFFGCW